jgi:FkbM family methyltransferase
MKIPFDIFYNVRPSTLAGAYKRWRYNRYATTAAKPVYSEEQLRQEGYYSQYGQDKWVVENIAKGIQPGTFVDIGAHDGVSFSNTCFLERNLGWNGLAIEPMPDVYERLRSNRSCITVQGGVDAASRTARFFRISGYAEMLSGIVDQYDSRHVRRIQREIDKYGGKIEEISIRCFTVDELLNAHNIRHVHYLSMDVEGSELSILRSIDFDRIKVDVLGIENNYKDYRIPQLMSEKGFRLTAIVGDEFYVRTKSQFFAITDGIPTGCGANWPEGNKSPRQAGRQGRAGEPRLSTSRVTNREKYRRRLGGNASRKSGRSTRCNVPVARAR